MTLTDAGSAAQDAEFQSRMRQLEGLLRDVDSIPDAAARTKTGQVIQGLMEFHGAGLSTILRHLADAGAAGQSILDALARDDLVGSLLLLYDLHPLDLEARVGLALDKVRPYLASHGGSVSLLRVTPDGQVHLRMDGSCHGCPSSAATLKSTIEEAILEKAPDVTAIRVEGDTASHASGGANGFVPVENLTRGNGKSPQAKQGATAHAIS
jgi:Fe-S cluster biogenesis protein NfuA